MEITQNIFKKILLLTIILVFINITLESFSSIFTNYDTLEDDLHKGYLLNLLNDIVIVIILSILFVSYFVSMAFLYFFKPIGRPLYLFNMIASYVFMTLTGDQIYYGLTIAINDFTVFLDFFILYLIYLTPLRKEFQKRT
jgi:hypothetical protein